MWDKPSGYCEDQGDVYDFMQIPQNLNFDRMELNTAFNPSSVIYDNYICVYI